MAQLLQTKLELSDAALRSWLPFYLCAVLAVIFWRDLELPQPHVFQIIVYQTQQHLVGRMCKLLMKSLVIRRLIQE